MERTTAVTKSFKGSNRPLILGALFANFAVFVLAVKTDSLVISGAAAMIREWQSLLPAGVGVALAGILNEQLSANTKSQLVFWRWTNPLPGSEAFTRYAPTDPRLNMRVLVEKLGTLPTKPREQNALWFSLYKKVERQPSVTQAHREYLFTRDYASLSFLTLIVLGGAGLWLIPSIQTAGLYVLVLLTQYLVVRRAAKNNGVAFVTNVLAENAAN